MKHADFSVKRVESFRCKPAKRQSLYWDGYAPGLGVRVTAAGTKSYIFEAWLHGRTVRITIGDTRTWTLGAAQNEATRLKTLTDQGIDPRRVRKEQEAAAEAARLKEAHGLVLVGKAWDEYIESEKSNWGPSHLEQHRTFASAGGKKWKRGTAIKVPGVLYPLMTMRLAEITSEVLIEWLSKESATRATSARQAYSMFRTFWKWCGDKKSQYKSIIDRSVTSDPDVRKVVPDPRTKLGDVLQRAQLKPWFAAVRALPNRIVSAYLQTLLLTGARREELAELKWEHVDFVWNSMWIKDKVEDGGRTIPLTPYVASLLKALPHLNEWVFSSKKSKSGRIREPIRLHKRALASANIPHVTIHGLRRTFASLEQWLLLPKGVVKQIMGHKPVGTADQHYVSRPIDLLAAWHNKYEAWILGEAGIPFGAQKEVPHESEKPLVAIETPRLQLVVNR